MKASAFNTTMILALSLVMSACGKNGFQIRDMKNAPEVQVRVDKADLPVPSDQPAPKVEADKKADQQKPDPTGTMGGERSSGVQNPSTGAQNSTAPSAPKTAEQKELDSHTKVPTTHTILPTIPSYSIPLAKKVLEFLGMSGSHPTAAAKQEKPDNIPASVVTEDSKQTDFFKKEEAAKALKTKFRPVSTAKTNSDKKQGIWTRLLESKFGQRLNAMFSRELSGKEKTKWSAIFSEMQRVTTEKDREELLIMETSKAMELSAKFEEDPMREISPIGAHTSAMATAVRHKCPQAPCAEFMSEIIRQAYKRAGYELGEDFSAEKKSQLIWSHTALVTTFGNSLLRAGWTVWDYTKYYPPVGAILMHTAGNSPSHTYMSAGNNGMFIIDNAHPRGFDLTKADQKLIDFEYSTGAFFLPPGQKPVSRQAPETNP